MGSKRNISLTPRLLEKLALLRPGYMFGCYQVNLCACKIKYVKLKRKTHVRRLAICLDVIR